ncbi:hypothetical protein E4U35_008458 [Claviceps purpurea]|nr:hypothetical protein E4U11_002720 [Claviceps purpurea]KAG6208439.1 hypothetical protein E4U35_008458 [Claviceps purpurea]
MPQWGRYRETASAALVVTRCRSGGKEQREIRDREIEMDLSPADVGEGASGQNVADTKRAEASSSGQGQQGSSSHGPRTMSKASIMKMHEERIRKMGEKHGIEFGPSDIFSNDPSEMVDRVDKPIRMRTKHDRGSANLEEMQAVMKVTREHSGNLSNLLSGDYQVELKRLAETGGPGLVHRKPRQRAPQVLICIGQLVRKRAKLPVGSPQASLV